MRAMKPRVGLLAAALAAAAAADKTDLTGVWKAKIEESDFGARKGRSRVAGSI